MHLNANILFINDMYDYKLYVLVLKVHHMLYLPNTIILNFCKLKLGYNKHSTNLKFVEYESKLNCRCFSSVVTCVFNWNALSTVHHLLDS